MHCCSFNMGLSVEPHGKCVVAFSLAWPSPKVNFVKGSTFWRLEEEIEKWQNLFLRMRHYQNGSPLLSSNMLNDQDQLRELENAVVKETEAKMNYRKRVVVEHTNDNR
ncbi:hypothetical protein HKD37_09G025953 [Glycine soja]|uniref:Uncharacterized protein n=1 Tax=Glycine soja TaxID=3848 RepID=A0A445J296_GLYSO|nr:hypothetical protein D0Y65_024465 [Glycine soja]RZB92503.1 hypothetical protein D0Y65_024465 [Glycine soja]